MEIRENVMWALISSKDADCCSRIASPGLA